MIVSSRMVKPHMVKKWARPGTVHCRSLRWPATSTVSASTLGRMLPRVRLGSFFPERMSLDSQWKRRAAMPNPTTVHQEANDDSDRHEYSSPSVTAWLLANREAAEVRAPPGISLRPRG